MDVDHLAQQLADTRSDPGACVRQLHSLKDSLQEAYQNSLYEPWLQRLLPLLSRIVNESKPAFVDTNEHRIREAAFAVLVKLPQSESLRPHVKELGALCLHVIHTDNEEVACLALKLYAELLKSFQQLLEEHTLNYFSFLQSIFSNNNFEAIFDYHFSEQFNELYNRVSGKLAMLSQHPADTELPVATINLTQSDDDVMHDAALCALPAVTVLPDRTICSSKQSFRVMAECLPVLLTLMSIHPRYNDVNLNSILPTMLLVMQRGVLTTAPSPPQSLYLKLAPDFATEPHAQQSKPSLQLQFSDSRRNTESLLWIQLLRERDQRFHTAVHEFYVVQTKCLHLIASVARSTNANPLPAIVSSADQISQALVTLLQIPAEYPQQRREVLSSMRYLLMSEAVKKSVYKCKDKLLEDKLLTSESDRSSIRPLASGVLVDLIAPIRHEFSLAQLQKIQLIFSRNLHDPSLSLAFQHTCLRLLTQLVDAIVKNQEGPDGRPSSRQMLSRLLMTMVHKIETLQHFIPKVLHTLKMNSQDLAAKMELNKNSESGVVVPTVILLRPAGTFQQGRGDEDAEDPVRDAKFMLLQLVQSIKTVVFMMNSFKVPMLTANNQMSNNAPPASKKIPIEEEEINLLCRMIDAGLRCFRFYSIPVPPYLPGTPVPSPQQVELEERQVIEAFASIFTSLEPRYFRDVWSQSIDILFSHIVERQTFILLPQHFLQSSSAPATNISGTASNHPQVARAFADILLGFLLRNLHQLSIPSSESSASLVLASLFRFVLSAVESMESTLRPYVVPLVSNLCRIMLEVHTPLSHLTALRHLFRALGSNRYDTLYKELLPCIPELVSALTKLQLRGSSHVRDLAIDLSLTMPARLTTLLMYMPALLRCVLHALQSKEEAVVKVGVRTLEFWIENVNASYLYTHIKPILREFFTAIILLLKPSPLSGYGTHALLLLGKFGGRARRFLNKAQALEWKNEINHGLLLQMRFVDQADFFSLPLDQAIDEACKIIDLAPFVSDKETDKRDADKRPLTSKVPISEVVSQAYFFLRSCLLALMDLSGDVDSVWHLQMQSSLPDLKAGIVSSAQSIDSAIQRPVVVNKPEDDTSDDMEQEKTAGQQTEPMSTTQSWPQIDSPAIDDSEDVALRARMYSSSTRHIAYILIVSVLQVNANQTLLKASCDAAEFTRGLCVHFAAVAASCTKVTSADPPAIGASVFVQAIARIFDDEQLERREVAVNALRIFIVAIQSFIGPTAACECSIMHDVLSSVCHACYSERWECKSIGCQALIMMYEEMPASWVSANEPDIFRALFAVFSDESSHDQEQISSIAYSALESLVRRACLGQEKPSTVSMDISEEERKSVVLDSHSTLPQLSSATLLKSKSTLRHLIVLLASNFISSCAKVRGIAQKLVLLASSLTGFSVHDLLFAHRESLLRPVMTKMLAACPVSERIGFLSAASFLITTCEPSMVTHKEIVFLVRVALDAVDFCETELALQVTSSSRPARHALLIKLRVESLYIMGAAFRPNEHIKRESEAQAQLQLQYDEHVRKIAAEQGKDLKDPTLVLPRPPDNPHHEWKERCCRFLFRSLLSRTAAVSAAAQQGLQAVLHRDSARYSKDMLISTMRTLLPNFSDHRKLTVALLEGSIKLIKVVPMSGQTFVSLSDTLYKHAFNFASPENILKMREDSSKDSGSWVKLRPDEEIRVPLLILEMLSLLQLTEPNWIDQLVQLVLRLEEIFLQLICQGMVSLPSSLVVPPAPLLKVQSSPPSATTVNLNITTASPYRLPLIQFLNKSTRRSTDYFYRNLAVRKITSFFVALLKYPEAEPLRQQIYKDEKSFMFWTFQFSRELADQYTSLLHQAHQKQPLQQISAIATTSNQSSQNGGVTEPSSGEASDVFNQLADSLLAEMSANMVHQNISLGPGCQPAQLFAAEWEERILRGVDLACVLTAQHPEFLSDSLMRAIYELWDSPARMQRVWEASVPLHQIEESRNLVLLLLMWLRRHHGDVGAIMKVLTVFKARSLTDFTFLIDFVELEMTKDWTVDEQRQMIKGCLHSCESPQVSITNKTRAWRYLVRPLLQINLKTRMKPPIADETANTLESIFKADDNLLDADLVASIMFVFQQEQKPSISVADRDLDDYKVELLRVNSLLVRFIAAELSQEQHEILVAFASSQTKSENALTKQWAHLAMARIVSSPHFSLTNLIVQDLFFALLKAYTPEGRILYSKALDIVLPVMAARSSLDPGQQYPSWIRMTRKVLLDESSAMPCLLHVHGAILRHPHLFYPYRVLFFPTMIQGLNKTLNLPQRTPMEFRRYIHHLSELLLAWDKQARYDWQEKQKDLFQRHNLVSAEATESNNAMDVERDQPPRKKQESTFPVCDVLSEAPPELEEVPPSLERPNKSSPQVVNTWQQIVSLAANPASVDQLLLYLSRYVVATCTDVEQRSFSRKLLPIIKNMCELWKDRGSEVKLAHIERIINAQTSNVQVNVETSSLYLPSIETLNAFFKYASPMYLAQNAALAEKCMFGLVTGMRTVPIKEALCETLSIFLKAIPMDAQCLPAVASTVELTNFYKTIREFIFTSAIKSVDIKTQHLYFPVALLSIIDGFTPTAIDNQMGALVRCVAKTCKEVVAKQQAINQTRGASSQALQDEKIRQHQALDALCKLLNICFEHVTSLGEHRKLFVQSVSALVTELQDQPNTLLEIAKHLDKLISCAVTTRAGNQASGANESSQSTGDVAVGALSNDSTSSRTLNAPMEGITQSAVQNSSQTLSVKDRCTLLSKLANHEREKGYTDLVLCCLKTTLAVFQDHPRRLEYLTRLQRVFIQGLRYEEKVEVRHAFRDIFTSSVEQKLSNRLYYIFVTQDWEVLSDCYWPSHVIDLLLDVIDLDMPLDVVRSIPKLLSFDRRSHILVKNTNDVEMHSCHAGVMQALNVSSSEDGSRKRTHSQMMTGLGSNKEKGSTFQEQNNLDLNRNKEKDQNVTSSALTLKDISLEGIVTLYKAWLIRYNHARIGDIVNPLRDLCVYNANIAHTTFDSVLPVTWSCLSSPQRQELTPSILAMLVRPWHNRFFKESLVRSLERIHPVQTLMSAIKSFQPGITISADVQQYAGKSFNAWYQAIDLLESSIIPSLSNNGDNSSQNIPPGAYEALSALYRDLNDEDMWTAAVRKQTSSDLTTTSLAHAQLGNWNKAQDSLFLAMSKQYQRQDTTDGVDFLVSQNEEIIWETEWVRAAKHLNQWEVLKDFSEKMGMVELSWEASWRLGDWNSFKDYCSRYLQQNEYSPGRLLLLYQKVQERKVSSEEYHGILDSTIQHHLLREWMLMPSIIGVAHIPLLVTAQKMSELQESCLLLDQVNKNNKLNNGTTPNFKQQILLWRDRMPCKWEELTTWSDILLWRYHFYGILTQACASTNTNEHIISNARVNDSAWTLTKLASAARHQQMPGVCLSTLAKLLHPSMPQLTSDDSYSKLREQISMCLKNPTEYNMALNIVSATNLDYFTAEQKAEMFRLKGEALFLLGFGDESNMAYSNALSVNDQFGKGWLSWGMFCDKVYTIKRDTQWAEHATVCFIQAINAKHKKAVPYLARVMSMIMSDKDNGLVQRAFLRYHEHVPQWVWLLWIPQLITSLARAEGPVCKSILSRLARVYPQALMSSLRAANMDKRELSQARQRYHVSQQQIQQQQQAHQQLQQQQQVAVNTTPNVEQQDPAAMKSDLSAVAPRPEHKAEDSAIESASTGINAQPSSGHSSSQASHNNASTRAPSESSSYAYGEEIQLLLRRYYLLLTADMERIVDELSRRFRAEPEEDLTSNLHVFITRCFKSNSPNDEISASQLMTLERMHKQYFVDVTALTSSSTVLARYLPFVAHNKARFEFDFVPKSSEESQRQFPVSISGLIVRLTRWKAYMHWYLLHNQVLSKPRLQRVSAYLSQVLSHDIEIPGQYAVHDREPTPEHHVLLSRFSMDVTIPQANVGVFHRRIGMLGDDGHTYFFIVAPAASQVWRAEERHMQLYVILNRYINQHKMARQRQLMFQSQVVMPLTHKVRLLSSHESSISMEEIYERSCVSLGIDPQAPMVAHREALKYNPNPNGSGEIDVSSRLRAYNHITTTMVPDTLLQRFMQCTLPSLPAYYAMRSEFTRQIALTGHLSYILKIGDRTPAKITLHRHSGRVINQELFLTHGDIGHPVVDELVPFRLTRNFQRFIGLLGQDGPLTASLYALNSVLSANIELFRSYMSLYIRDDWMSWAVWKAYIETDPHFRDIERKSRERQSAQTVALVKRITTLISTQSSSTDSVRKSEAATAKMSMYVRWATHKSKICLQPVTWQGWF